MNDDDNYDDDSSEPDASYSAERWTPTETSGLLVAGRKFQAPGETFSFADAKAAVAAVEALGGGLTLVLPGDTTTTGPEDTEPCDCDLVVGVVVASVWANDGAPSRVDRAAVQSELAAASTRDHAAIAAALPGPLRDLYLAASGELLLLVPVGPLPYTSLVFGVAGVAEDQGRPGQFHRGVDMNQEGHTEGVWGDKLKSCEFNAVVALELDRECGADGAGYWLIARYD